MKNAFNKNGDSKTPKKVSGHMIRDASAKKLFHIALKIVNNKEIAEGIVHDVFSDIWERRDNLKINVPIEAYAVKAVKFSAFDYPKAKVKKDKANEAISTLTTTVTNPIEEEIHARELKTKITHLVSQLPARCQEVFRLRREKLMSNKEIASTLNISEKTVERHMTRALHFLRISLK